MINRVKQAVKSLLLQNPRKANYKFILKNWSHLFDLRYCSMILETKRFSQNLHPIALDAPRAKRVLVFAPHPDDDIFGAGGTLVKLAQQGAEIKTVYITNASSDQVTEHSIKEEAREACRRVHSEPIFLDQPTRDIPVSNAMASRVKDIVDSFAPEVLFTTFLLDDHDDHRRLNQLLLNALSERNRDIEVWAYQIYTTVLPNVVVDITGQIQEKEEIMRLFQSVRGDRDWAHYILGMNAANCRYLPVKNKVYAETFFVVPLSEYLDLCRVYFSNPLDKIYYEPNYQTL